MNIIDQQLSQRIAWDYCQSILPEFYQERPFLHVIADTFQYLLQGSECEQFIIDRIESSDYVEKFNHNPKDASVSLPPRSGKSITITLCCSWGLGNYPEESIMRVTHSQRLFNKFSRALREFIKLPLNREIFPYVELSKDNTEVAGWSLVQSKQRAFFGSGVGGGIVGDGSSLIAITDDLYKSNKEAQSETTNESTLDFMESAFDSRKEKECVQFDVGTRWTKKDYIGRKLENDDYDIVIRVPALDSNDETFCSDVKTTQQYRNTRARLKREGKDHIWNAEYQQDPIDIQGILFPANEMKRFSIKELNMDNCIGKITFVDTADEGKDFYSAPVGSIFPSNDNIYDVFITKVLYTQDNLVIVQPIQSAIINDENIDYTFIETNKEGSLYVNNIRLACKGSKVKGLRSKANKQTRILMQSGDIMNLHFLIDDDQDEQYKAYFTHLTEYLKEGSEPDDAPDSTAGLVKAIKSIFKYLKNRKNDPD